MVVVCDKCNRAYDDAEQWTICQHGPLWAAHDAYCPRHDLVNCFICAEEKQKEKTNDGRIYFDG